MSKIRRVNKISTSLEVNLDPKMKEDGYVQEMEGDWIRGDGLVSLAPGEWKFANLRKAPERKRKLKPETGVPTDAEAKVVEGD